MIYELFLRCQTDDKSVLNYLFKIQSQKINSVSGLNEMHRIREDIHSILSPVNVIQRDMEHMVQSLNTVNNINNSNNRMQNVVNEFHITMPNVTNSTAVTELMMDLQALATKKMQFFD